jgi:hypothetical protein
MAQIQEPVSPYKAEYPYNNAMQTESGHMQEFDDTPGAERIRIQHKTGTFTEMHADGSHVCKIIGDGYYITAQDGNVIINGQCNINIVGNAEITVGGDAITNVKGSVNQTVEKDYNLLVKGNYTVTGSKIMNFIAPTDNINITSVKQAIFNTDISVSGEVHAQSLHSTGSISAGTGIHAGHPDSANPYAGITTLGGITAGAAGPTAGIGVIIGTVSAFAPIVSDLFSSMELLRLKLDWHDHIGNIGYPTTPPTEPFEV